MAALQAIPATARLPAYPFYAAARGEMHRRAGRLREAADAFRSALSNARSATEAQFFRDRVAACER